MDNMNKADFGKDTSSWLEGLAPAMHKEGDGFPLQTHNTEDLYKCITRETFLDM